ncbi:MAG: Putative Fe-S oxidoreductase [Methanomicrobiales archaeon 53_19]|nr:MAG: Putative Fe-S oxidoreductase [Methanocalculus sp. 52_23]KUL04866.1 MAG: Putative Fe-S oxidoreductase [Methanomicrobiales archaeon 53_19]
MTLICSPDTLITLQHERECMGSQFTCTLCGRCCNGFGRYITINQKIGGAYGCSLSLTKESFMAVLDPGRSELFSDTSYQNEHPHACPFLRKEDEETIVCTIYQSRPRFCREYICCTGKVMRQDTVCGEMKGRRDIKTADPALQRAWNGLKERYGGEPDPQWKDGVRKTLTASGYDVIFYE